MAEEKRNLKRIKQGHSQCPHSEWHCQVEKSEKEDGVVSNRYWEVRMTFSNLKSR